MNNPVDLFKLITGEKATLFSYTMSANVSVANITETLESIPVSPVFTELDLGVTFGMTLKGGATFGFDTSGFQSGKLADGFFIQNAALKATVTAGLSGLINEADLAGYQITGAVTGGISASLSGGNTSTVYGSLIKGALHFSSVPFTFGITGKFMTAQQLLPMLINQASPYLKTLVGTDAQVAAAILNGKGVNPTQIAQALGTMYGIPPSATAEILNKLNIGAGDIAGALKSVYKTAPADAATILQSLGVSSTQIAGALESTYGETASQAGQVLQELAAEDRALHYGGRPAEPAGAQHRQQLVQRPSDALNNTANNSIASWNQFLANAQTSYNNALASANNTYNTNLASALSSFNSIQSSMNNTVSEWTSSAQYQRGELGHLDGRLEVMGVEQPGQGPPDAVEHRVRTIRRSGARPSSKW